MYTIYKRRIVKISW